MGDLGAGIFEGADGGMSSPDPQVRELALSRMIDLAAISQVPMTFGLVATRGAGYLLDFLDDAAAAGGRVIAQTHCRGISVVLSFKTRVPFDLLPEWREFRTRPEAEQLRALRDPERRRALVDAAKDARVRDVSRRRRAGAAARLRGHPRVPPRAAAQSVSRRRRT